MTSQSISLLCRTATPFLAAGGIDEPGFRQFLQRFIENRIGVVIGSSGTGEGYSLTPAELRALFAIAVDECRGKIPVYGNPPEQHTARVTCELSRLAVEAGVDFVTVFALAGWHGMRPTDLELNGYFDRVFAAIRHPTALAVNPLVGYIPKARLIADVCRRHPQIVSVILTGVSDAYFVELRDLVDRKLEYFAPLTGSLNMLALGATGLFATEANVLPKTYRRYVDLCEAGRFAETGPLYSDIKRFLHFVSAWNPSNARWIKMYMTAFGLPGGAGGLREPYQLPPEAEMTRFVEGLLALGIPEVDEAARAHGLRKAS
jgi:4-hydroxy-tetrahydrodipicolinate synthase